MADTLVSRVLREPVVSATEPRKNPTTHIAHGLKDNVTSDESVKTFGGSWPFAAGLISIVLCGIVVGVASVNNQIPLRSL